MRGLPDPATTYRWCAWTWLGIAFAWFALALVLPGSTAAAVLAGLCLVVSAVYAWAAAVLR